jgi:predicted N-acetyltransferase YhbS
MDIKIRKEQVSDYSSTAGVNYEAFLNWHPDNPYVSEPVLVDILRHNSLFDPELSLVAELEGKVIGHAMFSPYKFIVLGKEQNGVVLAPIAIKPEFQKKGIGKLLIEEGHRIAKEKGFSFSLLCGHVGYYPRFGYKTGMFSLSGTRINIRIENFSSEAFSEWPIAEKDLPWISEAWEKVHGTDSLAIFPGKSISDWSNHFYGSRCSVMIKDGRILGYVRYSGSKSLIIEELIASNEDIPDVLRFLASKKFGMSHGEISIAYPPEKLTFISATNHFDVHDDRVVHDAFMIRVLDGESVIAKYCGQVGSGLMKPGVISFPSVFDVDDGRTD